MKDEQKAMGEKQDAIVRAIEDIPTPDPPPPALPYQEEISINLDVGLNDEDKAILAVNGFALPSEVYLAYLKNPASFDNIRVELYKVDKLNQTLIEGMLRMR